MKRVCSFCMLWLLIIVPLVACGPAAGPAASTGPQTSSSSTGQGAASTRSDWDSLLAEAKKEGSLVVYSGGSFGESTDVSAKLFREKYGIDISYIAGRGSEQAVKIATERKAGLYSADIMFGGLGTFFNVISPMKIMVPLQPLLVLPEVTDG